MGVACAFTPAKLIIPALLSAAASLEPVVHALEDTFGTLDYQSEEIPFTFTDYYTSEMGAGIRRVFFAVGDLYDPSELASLKLTTDELEERFALHRPGAGAGEPGSTAGAGEAGGARRPGEAGGARWLGEAGGARRRSVNLDPGMLTLGRLMLASTKDNAQRIPLRDGIYAEITLLYRKGKFEALPWTYPDYRSAAYHDVLLNLRARYKRQLEADSAHA